MPSTPPVTSPPPSGLERIFRLVPALDSARRYTLGDARADLVAGLTVAAVAVPQAMAYAMIAGLPVEHGLFTAIVVTVVGALFDSSRQLINGPTNAISIATLSVLAPLAPPEARMPLAVLLAFLVGLVQLGITALRLGDLSRYISHSVILGFTAGASGLLVLDQLKNLLGLPAAGDVRDSFLERFYRTIVESSGVHGPTLAVGVGSIVAVLLLRWGKQRLGVVFFPELLVVVAGAAVVVGRYDLEGHGVKVIGEIPARLPVFELPTFDAALVRQLAPGALAVALLGLLEAISMAKAIAVVTRQRLDMNQQCLSEGIANLSGSLFQCFPGSGSLTRSAINQQAGAATQWSGVVSAAAVAGVMVAFAPYARFIPKAALAGILMVTAFKMVDWRGLAYHLRATRFDAAIVLATGVSAIAISVEFCILIGVLLSFLLAVPRVGQILLTEFVVTRDGGVHERLPEDHPCPQILVFGLEGELFFGAAASLERHLQTIEDRIGPETRVVVLRMKRARNPDAVGLGMVEALVDELRRRELHVLMCGVRAELLERLRKTGLDARLGAGQLFIEQPVRLTSTLLAIRHAYTLIERPCATCPRRTGLGLDAAGPAGG
ncbi:MAG: SulP family inorganic anion transporter [Polyangiaceae bacterium]|nr:SulP family inorganic anion transporter [Polyangiaceae bacterium]